MKNVLHFAKAACLFLIILSFNQLALASQNANQDNASSKQIKIADLHHLMEVFQEHNYTTKSWQEGNKEVPRFMFNHVSANWSKTSSHIPVKQKKGVFFRLMAPLILLSNEAILEERKVAETADVTSQTFQSLAQKYRLQPSGHFYSEQDRAALLQRIDIIPPSLALAQSAEESGWATSRFTIEGNAFFGQWDFSGKGMVPKNQRKELGNYGLKRFDSPYASVQGYMLNINTGNAYHKLRDLRAQLRAENKTITGMELATTLDKYSERGQDYIDGIQAMIRYNKLQGVDQAYLAEEEVIHLITDSE
ncbi:glucosaminidase domain-containing protein [Thalassotalea agarivorans]|nr:glucosaminidase domain-containing protein [Thalassotalea agarivorans]